MQVFRFEKLNLFFTKIREITFWQRLFSWKSIRSHSYEAFEEFKALEEKISKLSTEYDGVEKKLAHLETQKEGLQNQIRQFERVEFQKNREINDLNQKNQELTDRMTELNKTISKFETNEEARRKEYENKISQINQIQERLDNEITRLNDERVQEQQKIFEKMKKQWTEHEASVEQTIKMICQNHLIKYIDKVPFRGNPDNSIEICGEYIIFDAKSPLNNDLSNFQRYLITQTENVKKYANQENVKKDIFLVVPSNTMEVISQSIYNMGDYNVYIVSKDSLEPIILSLKKIEDYEFAEQLSPEERENICRVIGKFAHTTKRKIQIDQFFANEFLELLVRCKNDLPQEILTQVIEYEKAEKLNPPSEKKSKQILTNDLQEKNQLLNSEAQIRGVIIPQTFDEMKNL